MIKVLITGIFKMCRLTEGILKQFGFTKAEHHQMLCHDWLSSRHVTIGTRAGKVLLLEDAELKQTIDVSSLIESSDISATNGTYTAHATLEHVGKKRTPNMNKPSFSKLFWMVPNNLQERINRK